uniref:Uncharacterized protein n=1 Tax=Arundo donax TaxID=35708 RepID=A0A0A9G4E5_ARUDO
MCPGSLWSLFHAVRFSQTWAPLRWIAPKFVPEAKCDQSTPGGLPMCLRSLWSSFRTGVKFWQPRRWVASNLAPEAKRDQNTLGGLPYVYGHFGACFGPV